MCTAASVIGGKEDFAKAVEAARKASVAVVVVGENPSNAGSGDVSATDGEGFDVATLDLTGAQEDLVQAVQATGTPVVLVLINGRPLSMPWEAAHVPAIVEAWEPGERGGEAVADVLFGDYNPSGRLAITIPRSSGQFPPITTTSLPKSTGCSRAGVTTEDTRICRHTALSLRLWTELYAVSVQQPSCRSAPNQQSGGGQK